MGEPNRTLKYTYSEALEGGFINEDDLLLGEENKENSVTLQKVLALIDNASTGKHVHS